MNHPDFRVNGKIFATLGPGEAWGMVKLTPEQQRLWIKAEPDVFEPFRGAWGRRGCTKVNFDMATPDVLDSALVAAWRNVAPKRLVQEFEAE
jgi:hypothetical protein